MYRYLGITYAIAGLIKFVVHRDIAWLSVAILGVVLAYDNPPFAQTTEDTP